MLLIIARNRTILIETKKILLKYMIKEFLSGTKITKMCKSNIHFSKKFLVDLKASKLSQLGHFRFDSTIRLREVILALWTSNLGVRVCLREVSAYGRLEM